jgi:hypothetical protein
MSVVLGPHAARHVVPCARARPTEYEFVSVRASALPAAVRA